MHIQTESPGQPEGCQPDPLSVFVEKRL